MKKIHKFFYPLIILAIAISWIGLPVSLHAQKESTIKDPRDNHVYQTVKIGKQTWMAENLKYKSKQGSWTYNSDSLNESTFGLLYDWNAASKACPKGWVLPSEQDWTLMINELGGKDVAGGKLQQSDSANMKIRKKTNEAGKSLSTLLGGVRHSDGIYSGIGLWGGFWSSTAANDGVKNYLFAHGDKEVGISTNEKGTGFSVRCVKK